MSETYSSNDYGIAGRTAALLSCTTQTPGMRATGWLSGSRGANGEATGESSNLIRFGNAQAMVGETTAISLIVCEASMQNRTRLAIAFAVFGCLASATLAVFTELSHFQPWNSGWAALIPFACPANFLLGWVLFDANATLLIWVLQIILNTAIYFGIGTLLGRLLWRSPARLT
jgi:hypothetical protein